MKALSIANGLQQAHTKQGGRTITWVGECKPKDPFDNVHGAVEQNDAMENGNKTKQPKKKTDKSKKRLNEGKFAQESKVKIMH